MEGPSQPFSNILMAIYELSKDGRINQEQRKALKGNHKKNSS